MQAKSLVRNSASYLVLAFFAFLFAFPFYYVLVLATQPATEVYGRHMWFGNGLTENFEVLFLALPSFWGNVYNSLGIALLSTVSVIFFCTLGGFAFAKYHFKFKKPLFAFVLATLAIPTFFNIIPFYKMMVDFQWINTWLPLIVPGMAGAFGIFLMTQFLQNSIPDELLDASRIDGLGEFRTFLYVVLPLARPGMAVLGIVTFVGSWNNFFGALVMLPGRESMTLPVAVAMLNALRNAAGSSEVSTMGALMLANALSLIPLVIIFIFFSKQIISGLTAGAVKS